ncbi:hypothetical protein ACFJGW_08850 [Burkholderiaceae bacterium UC74_6]
MRARLAALLLLPLALLGPLRAEASPESDALSACLVGATNTADREVLARWIFLVMAQHPTVASLANISPAVRDDQNKQFAGLIERLMTVDCRSQSRAAMTSGKGSGSDAALRTGFEVLGRIAMEGVMGHPAVNAAILEYLKYLDLNKFKDLLIP